jgi:hypothetical protein
MTKIVKLSDETLTEVNELLSNGYVFDYQFTANNSTYLMLRLRPIRETEPAPQADGRLVKRAIY